MKLAYPQLAAHLQKKLGAFYFISGDEIFLVEEAIATVREAAKKAGFTERSTVTAGPQVDWEQAIYSLSHDLSLFAQKKLIELDLSPIKLDAAIGKALAEYASKPCVDILFIVRTAKLNAAVEKTNWYKTIEQQATFVSIWPIALQQLPQWALQRAQKMGLALTKEAARRLTEQAEGNLLAIAQELEKLCLLQSTNALETDLIDEIVTDSAHYDIFNLVESALMADPVRCLRILKNLAAEKTEPTLVLWALARELRLLADIQYQLAEGATLAALFNQFRIWEKRQIGIRAFLKRHSQPYSWQLLVNAGKIDRTIKGTDKGNVWDELQQFALKIAGNDILSL